MKIWHRSFTIHFLAIALLFVIVGGCLHHFSHEACENQSSVLSVTTHDHHSADQDEDSCVRGFCHIGHCSHLLIPNTIVHVSAQTDVSEGFSFAFSWPAQVDLEGPFQPPRSI